MADISNTYSVSTGATVLAEDHNSHQIAIGRLNDELAVFAAGVATYAANSAWKDSNWGGGRTNCQVWADGTLYPNSTSTFGDITNWSDLWSPNWVNSFTYLSNAIDLGALYQCEVTLTPVGNFAAGNPTLEVHYATVASPSAGDWLVWSDPAPGTSVTTPRRAVRHMRFRVTVPQAGVDPCYLSALSYTVKGPKFTDADERTIALGWQAITFNKTFPQAPSLNVSAYYNAEQTLLPQVRNITATGFEVRLVQLDGVTPMNGVIGYVATAK